MKFKAVGGTEDQGFIPVKGFSLACFSPPPAGVEV